MPYLTNIKLYEQAECKELDGDILTLNDKKYKFEPLAVDKTINVIIANMAIEISKTASRDFHIMVIKKHDEAKYVFLFEEEKEPTIIVAPANSIV